jgi:eukaryotic-like serine/threonine-protein kinase
MSQDIPRAPDAPNDPSSLEIAHVLFMDIVAYSRLPMEEQSRLLIELQTLVRDSSEFLRAQERDQLLRLPTGDGMALIFFGNPEAPVRCAVEIGRALLQHTDLKLRMGLHSGPVQRIDDINSSRNVSGSGINYAQRVMDCGDAGHILVSRAVADVISETSRWNPALHDIGEVEVKHGARVHLYNLYGEGYGNDAIPAKVKAQQQQVLEVEKARRAKTRVKRWRLSVAVIAAGVILAVASAAIFYTHRAHALTDKDTVVLADFENKTGDPVFDVALKQGLSVLLAQSPFLNLLPDQKIDDTLTLMGRKRGDRLTAALARDICVRTNSKAMLAGSISPLGTQYVIGLKAIHCADGDVLAQEQSRAANKEEVLKALDKAAIDMRTQLGESLATVKSYNTPLEQATTPSLEALRALSEGLRIGTKEGDAATLPLFQQAIKLDPSFAEAYFCLGVSYANLRETSLAKQNLQKAYELQERASERERYLIVSGYYMLVTGEMEKAIQTYRRWAEAYPHDDVCPANLAYIYGALGRYEEALVEIIKAVRLTPDDVTGYANLMVSYLSLDRLQDAKAAYNEAMARKLEYWSLNVARYGVAFLERDAAEMHRQLTAAMGKTWEHAMFAARSDTEAYHGHFDNAGQFSRRAAEAATRNDQKETASFYCLNAALREAEVGYPAKARQKVTSAFPQAPSSDWEIMAALALARAGDSLRAQSMADDLNKRSPANTLLNVYYLPTIRAAIELNRSRPEKAVQFLEATSPYELGNPSPLNSLYPVYVRGEAYLAARQGQQAAAEFQKIIDHRGIVANWIFGALAHLQLGRAKAMSGDKDGAKKAYTDFLTLWKDADPDVPILKQAKTEYAKLDR